MILKESVMTNRRRKASDVEATGKPPERERPVVLRVGQTARVRKKAGDVEVTGKPLRKAGDVEAAGKPPE